MKENIAITINNLSKIYKNQKSYSLDNISLEIKSGIIFGLLGPNGAGKSTLINILADLVYKTSGTIKIFGKDYSKELYEIKPRIGIVPQELNMDPFFTPYELLELQAGLYGVPKEKRQTNKILNLLALEDKSDAYARTLSGGMKRRLLIAKAMVHDPEILVLDEPTLGLDLVYRKDFYSQLIEDYYEGDKTILISTHQVEEIEGVLSDAVFMNQGRIVMKDSIESINQKYLELRPDQNYLDAAKSLNPMHQRTELGREVMLFEDIDKDKLTALGDVRPPVIADLFMAIMETTKKGGQQ